MAKKPNKRARAWIKALLSDEYKQGKGQLKKGKKFCCLGVAADLEDKNGWGPNGVHKLSYNGNTNQTLSKEFWKKLTKGAANPLHQSELAEANDSGATFKEIVEDYILPMWGD